MNLITTQKNARRDTVKEKAESCQCKKQEHWQNSKAEVGKDNWQILKYTYLPGQHGQCLSGFTNPQRVLIQHINGGYEQTCSAHIIGVKITVRDSTQQVIVFSRQASATDGHPYFIHKTLKRIDVHLCTNTHTPLIDQNSPVMAYNQINMKQ